MATTAAHRQAPDIRAEPGNGTTDDGEGRLRRSGGLARPPARDAGAADPSAWLTVLLRPAGELGGAEALRFVHALDAAAAACDVVVLDLRSVMHLPRDVRRGIVRAHEALAASGGVLIVMDPDARQGLSGEIVDITQTVGVENLPPM
jgi:hypothetical protein